MSRTFNFLAVSVLMATVAISQASDYLQDDGTVNTSTVSGSHQILAAGYQVRENFDVIGSMEFYQFWDVNNGISARFLLWSDPTNDGNMVDALLLQSVTTQIQSPSPSGGWQTVNFDPQHLTVGSWFYVGMAFDDPEFQRFVGGNDTSGTFVGHSYTYEFAGQTTPEIMALGTLNPQGGTNLMIRANAVPEPATVLAITAGLAAVLRRRRKQ